MDFEDSPQEAAFRAEVRAWLDAHAEHKDDDGQLAAVGIFAEQQTSDAEGIEAARRWQRTLAEGGWGAPSWPVEYGGRGATLLELMVLGEELSRYRTPARVFEIGLAMLGPTIIAHGTEQQKQRYLPALLRGDDIWCQLWSEPGAGSDLASLRCRATRDETTGGWVLNGQKVWTSGAHYSQYGLGVFRSNPDAPKHKGITCLIVDMSAPGIEVRPLRQMTGGAHFNEVFFDNTPVPADNLVGEVDDGWTVARTTMLFERMAVTGMSPPSEDFVPLLKLARTMQRNGRPVTAHGVLRQRLARQYTQGRLFELTTARVRSALAAGQMPGSEASVLKLAAAQVTTAGAHLAVDVLGAGGALAGDDGIEGGRWIEALLGAPSLHIGGGTDNIQRNIIGEQVLGLPREPAPDRNQPFSAVQSS